jgi:hypothetical protein
MKVRNGFVSNSSSSSFVITTTLENHKRALKKLSPYVIAVIEALGGEEKKAFGVDLITFSTYSDNGGGSTFDSLEVEYEPEKAKKKVVTEEEENASDETDLESDEDEDVDDMEDSEDDEEGDPYGAFDEYCTEVRKDKKNVVETSVDF